MKKRLVVGLQAFGRRMPMAEALAVWLLLDRLHVPGWGFLIYYAALLFILSILVYDYTRVEQTKIEPFMDESGRITWREKIEPE